MRSCSALALALKLKSLNPYFVFQVNWVNELLYAYLKEKNLVESSAIENDLEMINHDFAGQEKDTRNVTDRSRLNYLVFLYLNELIFGNDRCTPYIMAEWRHNVSRRLSKYSYTTAFNKLKDEVSKVEHESFIAELYKSLLVKINQRISPKEWNLRIDWDAPWVFLVMVHAGHEVTCAIIDSSPLLLRHDEDRILAIKLMFVTDSFSQSFWDYVQDYSDLLKPFFNDPSKCSRVWIKALTKKFTPVEGNEALIYLLTRNAVNPFEIEVYKGFSMSLEENSSFLMKFYTNSLVYLDICSEIRSNGLCLEEQLSSSVKK